MRVPLIVQPSSKPPLQNEEEKLAFKEHKAGSKAAMATTVTTREAALEERLAEMEALLAAKMAEVTELKGGEEES